MDVSGAASAPVAPVASALLSANLSPELVWDDADGVASAFFSSP